MSGIPDGSAKRKAAPPGARLYTESVCIIFLTCDSNICINNIQYVIQ